MVLKAQIRYNIYYKLLNKENNVFYIRTNLVAAKKGTNQDYETEIKSGLGILTNDIKDGYIVTDQYGEKSWHEKEIFEQNAIAVPGDGTTVTQEVVDNFIVKYETTKLGEKTTLVRVDTISGFEIIETSTCVDPNNYDEQIGTSICLERAKDKLWCYIGFLLQVARIGRK